MQTVKQLSVMLANKPGRLARILTALNKQKVSLQALAVMDKGTRGMLRFVPDDAAAASSALDALNIPYDTTDVLLADVNGAAGAFAKSCERLAAEHLNIDYAYSSIGAAKGARGPSMAVIKVNAPDKARRILGEAGGNNHRPVRRPGRRPVHAR